MASRAKLILDLGISNDFTLLGIACHVKDYRFCWMLNQRMGICLRKISDFYPAENGSGGDEYGYACYFAEEDFREEQFYLLANRSGGKDLVDKYNVADYFLFIRDLAFPGGIRALIEEVKKIPQILTVFQIPHNDFRDAEFLLEGIEFARMAYEKDRRDQSRYPDSLRQLINS